MRQLDFNKGFINESNQEPEMITEFFGAMLLCGALAFMCSGSIFNMFSNIQKARAEYFKNKEELEKNKSDAKKAKAERQQEKEDLKKEKEQREYEEQTRKTAKQMMAFENAINAMDDGPEKENALKQLKSMKNIMSGDASIRELKEIEKLAKKPQPDKIQRFIDRVEIHVGKTPDSSVDKWLNDNNISSTNIVDGMTKVADEQIDQKQETEDKTDDEIKQELKDLKDEEQIKKLPDELKTEDGKINPEAIDKLSSEDLKKHAGTVGIETTKAKEPEQKQEPQEQPEKNEYTYLDKDDNEVTVKREKSDDGAYKYTKSVEGGEPQPADKSDFNTAKDEEGDDVQDSDERTDNDDDIEDEDTSGTNKQDPHKIWKRRTYKRGSKTFKTKSYYDKKGNSITAKEFKEKVRNFKNESYTGGWAMMPISWLSKQYTGSKVNESKESNDMVTICKERLVYIRFVMDTTSNSVEKVKMERMYNAIYNCCFDTNGKPRSMTDLYTYLNETMIENKGKIPGLPNNDQIMNIDDKLKAWRKTSPNRFDAYMARLDKENLDKSGTKKDNKAKDLLSPDHGNDDTKSIDKIRKLSDVYGFTNILGLEPSRKASSMDNDKKDEIKKQQSDGSPNADAKDSKDVNPEDISDEQIDKIMGLSK